MESPDSASSSELSSPPTSPSLTPRSSLVHSSPAPSLPLSSQPDRLPPAQDEIVAIQADGPADASPSAPVKPHAEEKETKKKKRSYSATITRSPLEAVTKVVKKVAEPALRRRNKKKWEAPFVYQSDKSPLATNESVDIRAILGKPEAWDCLSPGDQQEIIACFPDDRFILHAGTDAARPDMQALLNSNDFRNDCSRYLANIRDGRYDPEFIEQAWEAHRMRQKGVFDKYLAKKFKDNWGVELPADEPKQPHEPPPADPEQRPSHTEPEPSSQGPPDSKTPITSEETAVDVPMLDQAASSATPGSIPEDVTAGLGEIQVATQSGGSEDDSHRGKEDCEVPI